MFEKRKNREKKQNEELQDKLNAYLTTFGKALAEIENTKDAAEKILRLESLDYQIERARKYVERQMEALTRDRAKHTSKTYLRKTALTVATLPVITGLITMDMDWTSQKSVKEKARELEGKVDIIPFYETTTAYKKHVAEMLKATVANCDLDETSKSRYFPDALGYSPLKKRFEAAAIARAALGYKDLTPETEKQAPEKPRLTGSKPTLIRKSR